MSIMPAKVILSTLTRVKTLVASALSFGSVRWRLMAVLAAVSLIAYGFLLYGQYRDQYDKILSFAQSSNRLLTEVMARRIEGAVRKLDQREINRAVLDTIRATEIAIGHQRGQVSGDSSAALVAFAVIRTDGTIIKAYHSPLRLDVSEQLLTDLSQDVVKTGTTVD